VQCLEGRIYDVAVDIRRKSPTFGKWVGAYISDEEKELIYIPPGFAHGFYTVSKIALVAYKLTDEYHPQSEQGIIWDDPDINIKWPSKQILLSDKDKVFSKFENAKLFD
ncbi:dTDP-4-dehydrorhamnose 3,5-epimerase family protein, partial [Calditrichota bacterium]